MLVPNEVQFEDLRVESDCPVEIVGEDPDMKPPPRGVPVALGVWTGHALWSASTISSAAASR